MDSIERIIRVNTTENRPLKGDEGPKKFEFRVNLTKMEQEYLLKAIRKGRQHLTDFNLELFRESAGLTEVEFESIVGKGNRSGVTKKIKKTESYSLKNKTKSSTNKEAKETEEGFKILSEQNKLSGNGNHLLDVWKAL